MCVIYLRDVCSAVPSLLLGPASKFQSKRATIFQDYGYNQWSTTTLSTTALAVKNALLDPTHTSNMYLFIESFNVSQNELLSALEGLTKVKWDASYQDAEEEKRVALEKMKHGDYSVIPTLICYITCAEGYLWRGLYEI